MLATMACALLRLTGAGMELRELSGDLNADAHTSMSELGELFSVIYIRNVDSVIRLRNDGYRPWEDFYVEWWFFIIDKYIQHV